MNVTGIGPCVVDVLGIEADARVVLLSGHENALSATLGSAAVQVVDGARLVAVGEIARTNPIAATAIELRRAGVPQRRHRRRSVLFLTAAEPAWLQPLASFWNCAGLMLDTPRAT